MSLPLAGPRIVEHVGLFPKRTNTSSSVLVCGQTRTGPLGMYCKRTAKFRSVVCPFSQSKDQSSVAQLPTSELETESESESESAYLIKRVDGGIHLRFYFHETFGTTSILVARNNNSNNNSTLGNVNVFDDHLRVGPEQSSKQIGWAQGTDSAMNDQSITVSMNIVLTAGPFNGSTLALFGRVDASYNAERTVIGGTGHFRMARGYAISRLVRNPTPKYIVVKFDVYVKCDPCFMIDDGEER